MGVYGRADHLGCYTSVLLISPGVDRRRGTVNYHGSVFLLTFYFPGERGVQPVLAGLDSAVGLSLSYLPTEFPLDSTSG